MKKITKVLHVGLNHMTINGGIEKVIAQQIEFSADCQYDVLLHRPKNQIQEENVQFKNTQIFYTENYLYFNRFHPVKTIAKMRAYRKELRAFFSAHAYDIIVVHTSSWIRALVVRLVKKVAPTSIVIAHAHTDKLGGPTLKDKIGFRLYRKYADYLFGCSERALHAVFGAEIDDQKHFLIRNAINTERYRFHAQERQKIRQQLGIDEKTLTIGNVGRFFPQKNHAFMLEVLHEIKNRTIDFKMLLIGDGLLLEEIQAKTEQLGLAENLLFLGLRDDIPGLLSAMDVFLFPSLFEGLSLALIEAQASGLPCVVSDSISQESTVSDIICYLPLAAGPQLWADTVLGSAKKAIDRVQYASVVTAAGYDIKKEIVRIETLYQQIVKEAHAAKI